VPVDFVAAFPIPERLREPLRATFRDQPSEWPDLTQDEVRTLVEHGVAPLVYARAGVPQLRNEAIRAAAQESLRAADLAEMLGALAARGIEALVMKGTALAYDLYPAPELRPRGDTDLLVGRDDLEHVRSVMRELGFDELPTSGDEHGLRQAVFSRERGEVYDVHWSATNVPVFDAALPFDDLNVRAIALPALGPRAHGLGPVDALLLACIHRIAHHHDSDRLIWLADIALLRERMSPDEHQTFWFRASDARVVAVCSRSIEAADAWFAGERHDLAQDWLSREELARDEPSRVFLDRDITHAGVMAATMRALPWRARFERIWQLAFPPAEFIRQSFRTRNPLLLPWLYVYRGLRGLGRLFRRVAE
jgi:hypothetical protein